MTSRLQASVRQAGFTLFELVLVIVLVAVLMKVLLERFLIYQEAAEKAAMEQTAGALKSALNIQVAALVASGRSEEVARLTGVNPFMLLTERQRNYAGEFFKLEPGDVQPGNWYFDLKRKQAVYLVARGAHFVPDQEGRKEVRYKVELVLNDGFATGEKKTIGGISFRETRPYVWSVR